MAKERTALHTIEDSDTFLQKINLGFGALDFQKLKFPLIFRGNDNPERNLRMKIVHFYYLLTYYHSLKLKIALVNSITTFQRLKLVLNFTTTY